MVTRGYYSLSCALLESKRNGSLTAVGQGPSTFVTAAIWKNGLQQKNDGWDREELVEAVSTDCFHSVFLHCASPQLLGHKLSLS